MRQAAEVRAENVTPPYIDPVAPCQNASAARS